jgi:hypothetical protein
VKTQTMTRQRDCCKDSWIDGGWALTSMAKKINIKLVSYMFSMRARVYIYIYQ